MRSRIHLFLRRCPGGEHYLAREDLRRCTAEHHRAELGPTSVGWVTALEYSSLSLSVSFSYRNDQRSTKSHRELQVTATPSSPTSVRRASSHEPTERILRNGKRRGTDAAVTSKGNSFKVPPKPRSSKADEQPSSVHVKDEDDDDDRNSITEEKLPTKIDSNAEDEGCSSRSISPTTSARSSNSSPSTLSTQGTGPIPVDRSTKIEDPPISSHYPNEKLFPSSSNLSMYFPPSITTAASPYLHGSPTHPFNLSSFHQQLNKTRLPNSAYLPLSSPLYFNTFSNSSR